MVNPEEIAKCKDTILRILRDGKTYTSDEIHRAIDSPRKRATQIALSHLQAEGLITRWMQGMGFRYKIKSNNERERNQ